MLGSSDPVIAASTVSPPKLPHIGGHEFAGTVVRLPKSAIWLRISTLWRTRVGMTKSF
jgi:D-arabinose 1-dehydrogenase-like Zn-dependent alcohol dehydrogenase